MTHDEMRLLRAYRNADDNAKYFALQMLENNPAQKKETSPEQSTATIIQFRRKEGKEHAEKDS